MAPGPLFSVMYKNVTADWSILLGNCLASEIVSAVFVCQCLGSMLKTLVFVTCRHLKLSPPPCKAFCPSWIFFNDRNNIFLNFDTWLLRLQVVALDPER
jgi:hypothetical protein